MPATRCSRAPITGTLTRYPAANRPFGPHSWTTRLGLASRITCARQVYQAGSRVGAERLGSARNRHPSARPRTRAVSTMAHQELRMLRRPPVPVSAASGTVTISSVAMGAGAPFCLVGPGPVREPPKDTRPTGPNREPHYTMFLVVFASGRHGRF